MQKNDHHRSLASPAILMFGGQMLELLERIVADDPYRPERGHQGHGGIADGVHHALGEGLRARIVN